METHPRKPADESRLAAAARTSRGCGADMYPVRTKGG